MTIRLVPINVKLFTTIGINGADASTHITTYLYPNNNTITAKIDPKKPNISPSKTNGICIYLSVAPTNFIIFISRCLKITVCFIELPIMADITNMEINKTKERYSKCTYEIDMENNKVSNVKKLKYNNVNQEYLALINRIDEEKDLERFNYGINSTLMFVFFTPVCATDSTYYENKDFYNIIVKDNKRYVVMRIWEEENNKQLCDQLLKIKEGEMEIEKEYNGGIVKETRDLYLLENLMEVIQNIQ